MQVKTEAIVIRTTNYAESDKILTLYSREQGKIGVMAKGVRKPKSRLAAVSQLFTYGHYIYYARSKTPLLNQGEVLNSFRHIKEDLYKTSYAAYVVELMDKLMVDGEKNPFLFQLLYHTLTYMQEDKDPEILTRIFEVKMLQAAGLRPQLDVCSRCERDQGPMLFSVRAGGLLCEQCRHSDPYAIVLSGGAAKLLRLFQHLDVTRLGEITVKRETKQQLNRVLRAFIDEYTGVRLKSRAFLEQMESMFTHEDDQDGYQGKRDHNREGDGT